MRIVDPLAELRRYVAGFVSQSAAAKSLGVSAAYLCDLLHGNRSISKSLLTKLGLKRVVVK